MTVSRPCRFASSAGEKSRREKHGPNPRPVIFREPTPGSSEAIECRAGISKCPPRLWMVRPDRVGLPTFWFVVRRGCRPCFHGRLSPWLPSLAPSNGLLARRSAVRNIQLSEINRRGALRQGRPVTGDGRVTTKPLRMALRTRRVALQWLKSGL